MPRLGSRVRIPSRASDKNAESPEILNFRGFFYVQMERRGFSFSGASSSPIRRLESFEEPKKEVSLLELQAESWYNRLKGEG